MHASSTDVTKLRTASLVAKASAAAPCGAHGTISPQIATDPRKGGGRAGAGRSGAGPAAFDLVA